MSSQIVEIAANAVLSRTTDQISCDLSGEAVILNLASGIYYGLNEVGAEIWDLLQQPRSFAELHHLLMAAYTVPSEILHQDLIRILQELQQARLIEIRDGDQASFQRSDQT